MSWTREKIKQAAKYLRNRWTLGEIGAELGESVDDVAIACYGDGDVLVARDHSKDIRANARSNTVVLHIQGLSALSDETKNRLVHLAQLAADQFLATLLGADEPETEAPDVTHLIGTAREKVPDETTSDPATAGEAIATEGEHDEGTRDFERPVATTIRPEAPDDVGGPAGDGGQRVGRQDEEQHHAAPVPGAERRREGADAGDQGQGPGVPGPDRNDAADAGDIAGEDEPGAGGDVGGEVPHEIEPDELPVRSELRPPDPPRSEAVPRKDAGPAAPEPTTPPATVASPAARFYLRRASGDYLDKSGLGFTDKMDKAYRGTAEMIDTIMSMKVHLRDCERVPA